MVGILMLEVDFSAVVLFATLSFVEETTDSLLSDDIYKIGFFVDEFLDISVVAGDDCHSGSRQNFEPET